MKGPGKYDAFATDVRERTEAQAVILAVFGGTLGTGFSVQCADAALLKKLPGILRKVAVTLEADANTPDPG